jgi:hypothetical protein
LSAQVCDHFNAKIHRQRAQVKRRHPLRIPRVTQALLPVPSLMHCGTGRSACATDATRK